MAASNLQQLRSSIRQYAGVKGVLSSNTTLRTNTANYFGTNFAPSNLSLEDKNMLRTATNTLYSKNKDLWENLNALVKHVNQGKIDQTNSATLADIQKKMQIIHDKYIGVDKQSLPDEIKKLICAVFHNVAISIKHEFLSNKQGIDNNKLLSGYLKEIFINPTLKNVAETQQEINQTRKINQSAVDEVIPAEDLNQAADLSANVGMSIYNQLRTKIGGYSTLHQTIIGKFQTELINKGYTAARTSHLIDTLSAKLKQANSLAMRQLAEIVLTDDLPKINAGVSEAEKYLAELDNIIQDAGLDVTSIADLTQLSSARKEDFQQQEDQAQGKIEQLTAYDLTQLMKYTSTVLGETAATHIDQLTTIQNSLTKLAETFSDTTANNKIPLLATTVNQLENEFKQLLQEFKVTIDTDLTRLIDLHTAGYSDLNSIKTLAEKTHSQNTIAAITNYWQTKTHIEGLLSAMDASVSVIVTDTTAALATLEENKNTIIKAAKEENINETAQNAIAVIGDNEIKCFSANIANIQMKVANLTSKQQKLATICAIIDKKLPEINFAQLSLPELDIAEQNLQQVEKDVLAIIHKDYQQYSLNNCIEIAQILGTSFAAEDNSRFTTALNTLISKIKQQSRILQGDQLATVHTMLQRVLNHDEVARLNPKLAKLLQEYKTIYQQFNEQYKVLQDANKTIKELDAAIQPLDTLFAKYKEVLINIARILKLDLSLPLNESRELETTIAFLNFESGESLQQFAYQQFQKINQASSELFHAEGKKTQTLSSLNELRNKLDAEKITLNEQLGEVRTQTEDIARRGIFKVQDEIYVMLTAVKELRKAVNLGVIEFDHTKLNQVEQKIRALKAANKIDNLEEIVKLEEIAKDELSRLIHDYKTGSTKSDVMSNLLEISENSLNNLSNLLKDSFAKYKKLNNILETMTIENFANNATTLFSLYPNDNNIKNLIDKLSQTCKEHTFAQQVISNIDNAIVSAGEALENDVESSDIDKSISTAASLVKVISESEAFLDTLTTANSTSNNESAKLSLAAQICALNAENSFSSIKFNQIIDNYKTLTNINSTIADTNKLLKSKITNPLLFKATEKDPKLTHPLLVKIPHGPQAMTQEKFNSQLIAVEKQLSSLENELVPLATTFGQEFKIAPRVNSDNLSVSALIYRMYSILTGMKDITQQYQQLGALFDSILQAGESNPASGNAVQMLKAEEKAIYKTKATEIIVKTQKIDYESLLTAVKKLMESEEIDLNKLKIDIKVILHQFKQGTPTIDEYRSINSALQRLAEKYPRLENFISVYQRSVVRHYQLNNANKASSDGLVNSMLNLVLSSSPKLNKVSDEVKVANYPQFKQFKQNEKTVKEKINEIFNGIDSNSNYEGLKKQCIVCLAEMAYEDVITILESLPSSSNPQIAASITQVIDLVKKIEITKPVFTLPANDKGAILPLHEAFMSWKICLKNVLANKISDSEERKITNHEIIKKLWEESRKLYNLIILARFGGNLSQDELPDESIKELFLDSNYATLSNKTKNFLRQLFGYDVKGASGETSLGLILVALHGSFASLAEPARQSTPQSLVNLDPLVKNWQELKQYENVQEGQENIVDILYNMVYTNSQALHLLDEMPHNSTIDTIVRKIARC